ncbi:MAG: ATP-dependent DNA helicase RecG [Patescibacteria group bacterium]
MPSLETLKGIGPKSVLYLQKMGIFTPKELLFHFPHRYLDFSHFIKIKDLKTDTLVTVKGTITSFQNIFTRQRINLQKATLKDNTGELNLIWFNQPYLSKTLKPGKITQVAGQVGLFQNRPALISPRISLNATGKILPIYPASIRLSSAVLSKILTANLGYLLADIADPLPPKILQKFSLLPLGDALSETHQPSSIKLLSLAQNRLKIDEFLSLLAFSLDQKVKTSFLSPAFILKNKNKVDTLINKLPFKLTPSQSQAWQELKNDLLSATPCHRLLGGDVGSGKTIIAILGCYLSHLNGFQSLYLAPTEILARQHLITFNKFLPQLPVKLLTSKNKIKNIAKNAIIISTHAALYLPKNSFRKLAFLVVDEQHKFGVEQRNFFSHSRESGNPSNPHTLTMTATPIPRTLSLTLFGHLDISRLEILPSRRQVTTFFVPQPKISTCYQWLDKHLKTTGQQAFFVCPFIADSDTQTNVKSASSEFANLKNIFPKLRLELLHSQIKSETRDKIMSNFTLGKIDILVSTPIIEVGIDFPNAAVIIIQSADRFGLASLHQLRGRVGRSSKKSYCFLLSNNPKKIAQDRLSFMENHHNGLKIAEYDLKNRGPGEIYSTLQHGFPSLNLATIDDLDTLSLSQKIFESLKAIPGFNPQKLITHSTNTKISIN